MKKNMIKHFLSLHKNGGKMLKYVVDDNEVILCDGYFFFIQDRNKMVLNEKMFMDLEKDIFSEWINDNSYTEGKVACYLPTYRKNKFNILIKNSEEDRLDNRVIVNVEKLDLFDYHKIEIKGQIDIVKIYDTKGKLLGGVLPLRCSEESYKI